MHAGYLYLLGRVIGMGLERPLVKRLGRGMDATAVTVTYVGLGEVFFLVLIAAAALRQPGYFDGMLAWLPLALIPSLFHALSFHTFVRAMEVGEVSLLTPLFAAGFILMYIYDVLAGYAQLNWLPLSGVLLVALGVSFLNPGADDADGSQSPLAWNWRKLDPRWILRQPGAVLMLINAFGVATARYFDKTLAAEAEPLLYALVVNLPTVLIGLALLARKSSLREITRLISQRWQVATVLVVLGQGAFLLALLAFDYFPPSVVEPVTQLNVFIAVALGGLWFGERVRTRWLPSAMVVAGAVMLLM